MSIKQKDINLFFTPLHLKPKKLKEEEPKPEEPKITEFNWILHNDNILTTDQTPPLSARKVCSYNPNRDKTVLITLYDNRDKSHSYLEFEPLKSQMINLLKSNLQKCVRRLESEKGIRTAYSLLKADPKEIFRRWLIICIEDAVCCEAFPALTWITTALHYGYILQINDAQLFMNSVVSVLNDNRCDDLDVSPKSDSLDIKNFNIYPPIVQAILIRSTLGGMTHDMYMLVNCAKQWLEKGNYKSASTKHTISIDLETIESLTEDDILPESNDFHVSRKNLDKYERGDYSDMELRKAIWYHASGVIFRNSIREGSIRRARFEEGVERTAECWKNINKK